MLLRVPLHSHEKSEGFMLFSKVQLIHAREASADFGLLEGGQDP